MTGYGISRVGDGPLSSARRSTLKTVNEVQLPLLSEYFCGGRNTAELNSCNCLIVVRRYQEERTPKRI